MNIFKILFFIISCISMQICFANEHHDGEDSQHSADRHGEEQISKIDDDMAKKVGIQTSQVGAKVLRQNTTSFGRLTTAPEQSSHIRARFPGVIRTVAVNIGDKVEVGDLLAVVESNESLKRYELRAPINGIVTQRHANAGEMTQDQVLLSILSTEFLWAEMRIFQAQNYLVAVGQSVQIYAGEQEANARISHLLPAENSSPYRIARVKIDNSKGVWFPGLMVQGDIVSHEFEAELAVLKSALQTMDGKIGIFIKEGHDYQFTALKLGRADSEFIEVLSGAAANTEYVSVNSYLIKADIEKSESKHEH
ncbi:efflux RND transporter periplasmic adaptor subunit [Zhongshania sp. BJYM1]|uniref:efflux RND transporter periplasmic adaptor subunit n=1 Tax=Zhongshania aquatica TaxID=2965069 RepID=UPI0022B4CA4A|nr:efflux RND transporter periplasmic adaptor subunit [Marortus sp. BJYM1]